MSIGAMTAVQARINGVLGVRIDDGIVAGLISFAVGLVILIVVILPMPSGRAGVGRLLAGIRSRTIPFWMLLGGTCGALTVTTQGLVAGVLGVSLFTVGVVAGQTLHGLLLDRIGVGPSGIVAVTAGRVIGGALALVAVGISLSGDVLATAPLWLLLLPFAAGAGIAWQAAANGRLARRVASPLTATLMSFIAGTVVLLAGRRSASPAGGCPRRCRPSRGCSSAVCWASPTSCSARGWCRTPVCCCSASAACWASWSPQWRSTCSGRSIEAPPCGR